MWLRLLLLLYFHSAICLPLNEDPNASCYVKESKSNERKPCLFPFRFNEKVFNGCTNYDFRDENPWCSTKTDVDGNHIGEEGYWGDCPKSCKLELFENPKLNCTKTYKKSDRSRACAFFLTGYFKWSQADEECKARGAKLPVIKSESDNENIWSIKPSDEWIWLGISRSKENRDVFESYNSKLIYTNWAAGEPDDRGGNNEDCVSMSRNSGEWDDRPCTQSQVSTLCEKIYQIL